MVETHRRRLPRVGTRKLPEWITPDVQVSGIKRRRDGLFSLLREHQPLVRPKKSYSKTTLGKHWMRKYPNLMPGRTVQRPGQAHAIDMTYVESGEGVDCLSLITDMHSRKAMGAFVRMLHEG